MERQRHLLTTHLDAIAERTGLDAGKVNTQDPAFRREPWQPGYWLQPRWPDVWFPDAFVGTMAQLLCALEDGTEPEIGGRDNLETIALCEAVYAAAQEHRVTTVREFMV